MIDRGKALFWRPRSVLRVYVRKLASFEQLLTLIMKATERPFKQKNVEIGSRIEIVGEKPDKRAHNERTCFFDDNIIHDIGCEVTY